MDLNHQKTSVVVGIRNSLDSVATVVLLQRQGYKVSAVHVQTHNSELTHKLKLAQLHCQEGPIDGLRKICDGLSVPLYLVDMKQVFAEEIVDTALNSELMKLDFHPCFHCAKLKLIVLYQKMLKLEHDYFALGYYAKIRNPISKNINDEEKIQISAAKDLMYDQAPLVAQAPLELMSKLLLPLGDMMKDDVYNIVKNSVSNSLFESITNNSKTSSTNSQKKCVFFEDRVHAVTKTFLPNYLPKLRPFWRDTKTHLNESLDLVQCHAGEEIKIQGVFTNQKDQVLIIGKLDYSKREIEIGSKESLSFDICQLKIIQKLGDIESFRPISVLCRFSLESELHPAILSFRGLGFATLQFEKLMPFHALRSWITIYENNEKTLKCIYSARILTEWKKSDQGNPFFTPFDKLKEYPI